MALKKQKILGHLHRPQKKRKEIKIDVIEDLGPPQPQMKSLIPQSREQEEAKQNK